jgi:AcrR family transcriptional regulator
LKNKILENSTNLFNEKGVSLTSFRDIAAMMNISDGHVRYYFKTKETLLMSIFEQLDNEIIEAANLPISLNMDVYSLLRKNIEHVFNLTVKYRFLFVESPKTIYQYPALLKSYRNLIGRRKKMIFGTFETFNEMKLFNSSFDSLAKEQAFYTIFIISDGWLRTYQLTNTRVPDKKAIQFHADLIVNILKPYMKN